MLIEKIPQDELLKIDAWRKLYGYNENACYKSDQFSPIEEILQVWEGEKKDLFKLFGNKLIVKKEFQYNKSKDEMELEAYDILYPPKNDTVKFLKQYSSFLAERSYEIRHELSSLVNVNWLIDNVYKGKSFEVELPNGKNYRVSHGAKISRILGKLASAFNIEGYEEFRIIHSQLLNQKNLKGTLTLSIHPLDYMTMSDNNCGWESCMSWANEGDYRLGTTEMLNSPYVIVAYLTSDKDMTFYFNDEKYTWNSKKWRQLFIVSKDIIMGVKGYPYYNEDLTKAVLEYIRELAKENLGIEYTAIRKERNLYEVPYETPNNDRNICIYPSTNRMYNDFGSLPVVHLALRKGLIPEDLEKDTLHINYSGKAQCMVCGSVDKCINMDTTSLACPDCQELSYCSCCGETSTELYEVDGEYLCRDCYNQRVSFCDICEEEHISDNFKTIYVITKYTSEEREKLNAEYICFYKEDMAEGFLPYHLDIKFKVCKNEKCINEFIKEFLVEGGKIHQFKYTWGGLNSFVYFDELKTNVREGYCCYSDEAQYKNSYKSYQIEFIRIIEEN